MYAIGPFDGKTVKPFRPGVYFTSPFENGSGGGHGYWDGKAWSSFLNWGGDYWNGTRQWFWFGLTEAQSKDPAFIVSRG